MKKQLAPSLMCVDFLNFKAQLDIMEQKGIMSVPVLEVDGKMMNFTEANNWINNI